MPRVGFALNDPCFGPRGIGIAGEIKSMRVGGMGRGLRRAGVVAGNRGRRLHETIKAR